MTTEPNAPEAATNAPPPAKAPPKLPTFHSLRVEVPAGHVLPSGNVVKDPFAITVQYGARWHPDWAEPRVVVSAHRFLHLGDAIGWLGERALTFPLPEDAKRLAIYHGMPASAKAHLFPRMGLAIPEKREPYGALIVRPETRVTIQ